MKKSAMIAAAGLMSLLLAACSQTEGTQDMQTGAPAVEAEAQGGAETASVQQEAPAQPETQVQQEAPAQPETQVQQEAPAQPETPVQPEASGQPGSSEQAETGTGSGYADNFSVDSEAAAAFGIRVQEAVAAKDLEALADLTAYPLYVGFADGGESVESREEFVALGAERIFTPELLEAVGNADPGSLSPSMAGFVLSADGRPNIVFSVVNGSLAIQGINY